MVGQVASHVRHPDVVDVVVAQHLFGDLGAGQTAGELHFGVFAEYGLQAGLHDVAGDADGDNQKEHAGRGGGVVRAGRRLCVITCLKQGDKRL